MKAINSIKNGMNKLYVKTKDAVSNTNGEGYVDSAVKIIIAVVIGTLLLGGLYTLFNTTVIPTLTTKITSLFSYSAS